MAQINRPGALVLVTRGTDSFLDPTPSLRISYPRYDEVLRSRFPVSIIEQDVGQPTNCAVGGTNQAAPECAGYVYLLILSSFSVWRTNSSNFRVWFRPTPAAFRTTLPP